MIVNIVRHAIAEDRGKGLDDANRALTDEGRARVLPVLKLAAATGMAPDAILSSPLVRAMQTATIAAKVLKWKGDILQTTGLSPDATPEQTWEELRTHANRSEIVVVGHEPHLSRLAAYLLGSPELKVELKKGGIVRIRIDRLSGSPRGVLEWMLAPRLASGQRAR